VRPLASGAKRYLTRLRWALETATLVAVVAASCTGGAGAKPQPPPTGPPTIPDAQPAVIAPLFTGERAFPNPLARQAPDSPPLSTTRANAANSGVVDRAAPLGKSPVTGSDQVAVLPPLVFDRHGGLTTGCRVEFVPDIVKGCLAAVDPATFTITARWLPPAQDLNLASAVVDDQLRVLVTTQQGHVFVLQRPEVGGAVFHQLREIDLSPALPDGQALLSVRSDDDGNIWFTSGGPSGAGSPPTTATTVGYVTPAGQIATAHFADQIVESAMAVDHDNAFVITSPAGPADHPAATGSLYNLTANAGVVQVVWQEPYDAGGGRKPGGLTRGSGSPVVLLGDKYVAMTDNADGQVHLLIYDQAAPAGSRVVCRVPLFSPGASAVNAAPIGYAATGVASVIVANGFNAPAPTKAAADINGSANNLNQMAPGLTRVDVTGDGSGCTVAWSDQLRFKAPPVLSTATGLAYGYSQDEQRASAGSYIWYFVAVDYATGRVAWRQRAGAGGTKNDNQAPTSIGAAGTLYQSVPTGVVWMRDVGQHA
jgi:sugar lactone lactonase YvrE